MAQVSDANVLQLFKKCYGDVSSLLPTDFPLANDIAYTEKQRVGDEYIEAVVLTNETGWTLGGSGADAVDINPAVAGAVRQAKVSPYISILGSVVPFGVMSRSAGGGERAFMDATKHIVKNNMKSHGRLLEILRLYGQSTELLGYVSFATATYRSVVFTNGAGTLTLNGTAVTFTAGINAASRWILLAPGQFASGIWVGHEGVIVQQVNASGTVVAEGSLVEVDAEQGAIRVDFTPIAATTTTSHRLCFKGMAEAKDAIGIHRILTTAGTMFGISNTAYSLWKGTVSAVGGTKFTMAKLQAGVAAAVNRAGLQGDLKVYVNPRTWAGLVTTEAALRRYDANYKSSEAENGMESITFYHQVGKAEIVTHNVVKEGHAPALSLADWSRSGSAEVSFTVPGVNKEMIFPLENQTAYAFRTYSDQYVFCNAPGRSIYFDGINDESAT